MNAALRSPHPNALENLILWDCPRCGGFGHGAGAGDEAEWCDACEGSGEAEVTACCKELPGACECAESEAAHA